MFISKVFIVQFILEKMQLMNKSDGICKICNDLNETMCHLLVDCIHVIPIWEYIEEILFEITTQNIEFNAEMVIFGAKHVNGPYCT